MISSLFQRKWFAAFFLISLLFFQLIYSFLSPTCGSADTWQPLSTYLVKFPIGESDNFLLRTIYPLVSPEYRLNSDIGHYLELARNFSPQYFNGSPFLERPLYSFLIFLFSLPFRLFDASSYGIIFALSILLNFILISAAVLLFFSLLKKLFSLEVAYLSSILLIFSPYVRSSLIQPLAEMLMVFAVVASIYLIYHYARKPSALRLIFFSLIVGLFMLGKMFFAISVFILILAICFKRYKEGAIFLAVHLLPFLLWYLWVTQVWQIPYHSSDIQDWEFGIWVFNIVHWPWFWTLRILLSAIPNFVAALVFAFLLIPVFFSLIGFKSLPFKSKNLFYFGALFSYFVLAFMMNYYLVHHAFLVFPIIYPACVLGIERIAAFLRRYRAWYAAAFYAITIGLIVFISSIDFYKIFDYIGLHIRI